MQAKQLGKIVDFDLDKAISTLETAFKSLVSKLDEGVIWIVSHEDKDVKWFVDDEDNLASLRSLFRVNSINNFYRGSLLCLQEDLFEFSRDLVSYPYVLSYKNLDISHTRLPIVIKITDHLTIDLLSVDESLLKRIVDGVAFEHFNTAWYRRPRAD